MHSYRRRKASKPRFLKEGTDVGLSTGVGQNVQFKSIDFTFYLIELFT